MPTTHRDTAEYVARLAAAGIPLSLVAEVEAWLILRLEPMDRPLRAVPVTDDQLAAMEAEGAPAKALSRLRNWLYRRARKRLAAELLPRRGAARTAEILHCSRSGLYSLVRPRGAKNSPDLGQKMDSIGG